MSEEEIQSASGAVEPEVVDAVPVLASERELLPVPNAGPVAVQAAAVSAASFVAGAMVVALVRRRRRPRALSRAVRRRGRKGVAPVVASRSFLVDVHVLGDRK